MARYRLSNKALNDLERIYVYGITTFGLDQADRYYDGLLGRLQKIADNPEHTQAIDNVWPGLRRSVYQSHAVYYLMQRDDIQIVRILGREDITRALRET